MVSSNNRNIGAICGSCRNAAKDVWCYVFGSLLHAVSKYLTAFFFRAKKFKKSTVVVCFFQLMKALLSLETSGNSHSTHSVTSQKTRVSAVKCQILHTYIFMIIVFFMYFNRHIRQLSSSCLSVRPSTPPTLCLSALYNLSTYFHEVHISKSY
jgi:hypothetical protein